ncbi:PAAR domain-containing protein [Pseudoduganella sp. HUAS MS19]
MRKRRVWLRRPFDCNRDIAHSVWSAIDCHLSQYRFISDASCSENARSQGQTLAAYGRARLFAAMGSGHVRSVVLTWNSHPTPSKALMSLKIITVGDKTSHGGKVISGSPEHDIEGKAIARLGDEVDCPLHGVNQIVTAHKTLMAGDKPVAVEGCETECGCKLIGSANATVA